MESIKDLLKDMLTEIHKSNPKEMCEEALKILIKLFTNIVSNPKELRFRNFKKTNNTIKTHVLIIPDILNVLEVLGYSESSTDKDILVYEGESLSNFSTAIEVLNEILNKPKGIRVMMYQYDLTQGMARQMSLGLIGKQIEGVWHTSVCVYGKEYFYGGGICTGIPKKTPYGYPVKEQDFGFTEISQQMLEDYLKSIDSEYTMENYNLINHNCNHFTNNVLFFLTEKNLPDNILKQHEELLKTPMGQMLMPMLENMNKGNNQALPNIFEGRKK